MRLSAPIEHSSSTYNRPNRCFLVFPPPSGLYETSMTQSQAQSRLMDSRLLLFRTFNITNWRRLSPSQMSHKWTNINLHLSYHKSDFSGATRTFLHVLKLSRASYTTSPFSGRDSAPIFGQLAIDFRRVVHVTTRCSLNSIVSQNIIIFHPEFLFSWRYKMEILSMAGVVSKPSWNSRRKLRLVEK